MDSMTVDVARGYTKLYVIVELFSSATILIAAATNLATVLEKTLRRLMRLKTAFHS